MIIDSRWEKAIQRKESWIIAATCHQLFAYMMIVVLLILRHVTQWSTEHAMKKMARCNEVDMNRVMKCFNYILSYKKSSKKKCVTSRQGETV